MIKTNEKLMKELNSLKATELIQIVKKVKSIFRKYYSVEAYTLDRNKRILELETKDRNIIKVKFKKITNKNKFKIVNYEIKELEENSIDDNKRYDEMDDFDSNINLDSD